MSSIRNPTSSVETPMFNATTMRDFALAKILSIPAIKAENPAPVILEPKIENPKVYAVQLTIREQYFTLLNPAMDIDEAMAKKYRITGCSYLKNTLARVKELSAKTPKMIFIISLAESNPIFIGLNPRRHWTTLFIQGNNCFFFDSCPGYSLWRPGSFLYLLTPLRQLLQQAGIELKSSIYLAWQYDSVNCGRYSAEWIQRAVAFLLFNPLSSLSSFAESETAPNLENLIKESESFEPYPPLTENAAILKARWPGEDNQNQALRCSDDGDKDEDDLVLITKANSTAINSVNCLDRRVAPSAGLTAFENSSTDEKNAYEEDDFVAIVIPNTIKINDSNSPATMPSTSLLLTPHVNLPIPEDDTELLSSEPSNDSTLAHHDDEEKKSEPSFLAGKGITHGFTFDDLKPLSTSPHISITLSVSQCSQVTPRFVTADFRSATKPLRNYNQQLFAHNVALQTTLQRQNTQLTQTNSELTKAVANLKKSHTKKISGWKYALVATGVILGMIAIGTGVGILPIAAISLSFAVAVGVTSAGVVSFLSSSIYGGYAIRQNQKAERLYKSSYASIAGLIPKVAAVTIPNAVGLEDSSAEIHSSLERTHHSLSDGDMDLEIATFEEDKNENDERKQPSPY